MNFHKKEKEKKTRKTLTHKNPNAAATPLYLLYEYKPKVLRFEFGGSWETSSDSDCRYLSLPLYALLCLQFLASILSSLFKPSAILGCR